MFNISELTWKKGEQCDGTAGGVPLGGTGNNLPLTCKPGLYCDVAQRLEYLFLFSSLF
jgi:hypothetical protein